jgi:uncharacterized protein YbbK (DUF523 family)
MPRWVGKVISELRDRDLSGFVHKKGSPSCGLERIRVSDELARPPEANPETSRVFLEVLAGWRGTHIPGRRTLA